MTLHAPRRLDAAALPRRRLLLATLVPVLPGLAVATPEALAAAVQAHTGGAPLRDGRIRLDIAELVENGNTVPLGVQVDSPMTVADHVQTLALFTEKNPQPEVAVFHFSPASGRARISTRIRLATSQRLVAVARLSDGSHWRAQADVLVTLAACIES